VAIVGKSGSGKSTLMHLLAALDKPNEGEISIDGQNLAKMKKRRLNKLRNETFGFVFQQFNLLPRMSAAENVALPLLYSQKKIEVAKGQKILETLGLGNRAGHRPNELSGGQQQRVAIARALANRPRLILADEPTGNLDSANGAAIIDLFEKIRDESQTTIVIVTHDPSIAARADREIRLKDGVVLDD
jgi:ABC-type lipoprotein export system ATPase subunit